MITKDRIAELIKQEAMVFYSYYNVIKEIKLTDNHFVKLWDGNEEEPILEVYCGSYYSPEDCCEVEANEYIAKIKDLFEVKSDAEFDKKYGHVEKTIQMPKPPTWERFKKVKAYYGFNDYYKLYTNEYRTNGEVLILQNCFSSTIELELPLTEQSYYKALDKIVELFYGKRKIKEKI